jgi:hypothetical protein
VRYRESPVAFLSFLALRASRMVPTPEISQLRERILVKLNGATSSFWGTMNNKPYEEHATKDHANPLDPSPP